MNIEKKLWVGNQISFENSEEMALIYSCSHSAYLENVFHIKTVQYFSCANGDPYNAVTAYWAYAENDHIYLQHANRSLAYGSETGIEWTFSSLDEFRNLYEFPLIEFLEKMIEGENCGKR